MLLTELLKNHLTAARGNASPTTELNMGVCALLNSFPLTLHPVQTLSQNSHHKMCGCLACMEPHAAADWPAIFVLLRAEKYFSGEVYFCNQDTGHFHSVFAKGPLVVSPNQVFLPVMVAGEWFLPVVWQPTSLSLYFPPLLWLRRGNRAALVDTRHPARVNLPQEYKTEIKMLLQCFFPIKFWFIGQTMRPL